jgi:hypothetical protein
MHLSDEAIVSHKHMDHRTVPVSGYGYILRFPNGDSFLSWLVRQRPMQSTSIPNVFMAGDWVKGLDHGANGLSQERAYVTGLVAANLVCSRLDAGEQCSVIDVEEDEPHIKAGKDAVKGIRGVLDSLNISPLL